jgi:1-deoxy-D-xylulose-5-phosphate synthase
LKKSKLSKAHLLKKGAKTAVLSTGFIANNVSIALENLNQPETIAHYDFGFSKPLDEKLLHEIFSSFENIITIEDGTIKADLVRQLLNLPRKQLQNL